MLSLSLLVGLSVLATGVQSRDGLHLATDGLLQISPSFSGKGINLYPAHRPGHNASDLQHMTPKLQHDLYYAQEGHRDAMHGSKHGSLKANFTIPTVVLDHTSHLTSIRCSNNGSMETCFTPEAFQYVRRAWNVSSLNIVTYHIGCGDEYTGKRSYFHAQDIRLDTKSQCVTMRTTLVEQENAVTSGEITWGTYKHPNKRAATKGHIKLASSTRAQSADEPSSTLPPDDGEPVEPVDEGQEEDLTNNVDALTEFFENSDFDESNIHESVPDDEDPFISLDGTVDEVKEATPTEEATPTGESTPTEEKHARRSSSTAAATRQRHKSLKRDASARRNRIEDRGIVEFFEGIYNGIKKFIEDVASFFSGAVETVINIAKIVIKVAIVAAKVIAVPFGVPFDESYHNDFKFTHVLSGEGSTRPPAIFGNTDGFNLAGSGGIYSVQCVKCGTHGDFSVEGRLAFTTSGITHGEVMLVNNDPFTIDAVFGIVLEVQYDHSVKGFEKQLAAVPLSPLAIPGIITLGPELTISGALDLVLNGKAELLIGGTMSIGTGTAALSLVDKDQNKLDGFDSKFTPVAQFNGTLTASVELGLPIALEVGIDVLNGKFKKTVALVNKPSIYASASVTNRDDAKCRDGVELRAGVKNRFYVQALDLWDYDLRTDILYEKGIACVNSNGFDFNAVEDDISVFNAVTDTVGTDIITKPPQISDVASKFRPMQGKTGFRIVMDEDKSSILVVGGDGYVYLVETKEQYDLSAPLGTIDVTSGVFDLDVFGRILTYIADKDGRVADLRFFEPSKVPSKLHPAGLVLLKTNNQDYKRYGIILYNPKKQFLVIPTFCQSPKGLRMYGTTIAINKDSRAQGSPQELKGLAEGLRRFQGGGKLTCRSVQLTSDM